MIVDVRINDPLLFYIHQRSTANCVGNTILHIGTLGAWLAFVSVHYSYFNH